MYSKIKKFKDRVLQLETNNVCLLKCPTCDRQCFPETLKDTTTFSFDQVKCVLDAFNNFIFSGSSADVIYHPEFIQLIEYVANKKDVSVRIDTNGHGKSLEWWTSVFNITQNKNVCWQFMLDGLPKDSHIHRVGQNGEQVWEIMKLGASMECKVIWKYIVFNYNETDIEESKDMAQEHGIEFRLIRSNRFDNENVIHLKPSQGFYIERYK